MEIGIGFVLTLFVYSYLLGDNLLYRLTLAVFVGLVSAFTAIITFESLILPLLDGSLGNSLLIVIAGVLALLLLLKPFVALKSLTNLALAFLIAVGTAVTLIGTITGTLIPITLDTSRLVTSDVWAFVNSLIILIGVLSSLFYFRYVARRRPDGTIVRGRVSRSVATIGQGFIVVTFGVIYGATILTSLTILSGQVGQLFGQ